MNKSESQMVSSQPGLIKPIRAGFNVAANHIGLLIFPVILDLWIWLGIHLSMRTKMTEVLEELAQFMTGSAEQINQIMEISRELLIDRFNLMFLLRTYPVGIPSLMSARLPIEVPYGSPRMIDIGNVWNGLASLIGLSILGIAVGTLYYLVVSQAALSGTSSLSKALKKWPWAFIQVIALTIVWVIIAVAISLPFSCLLPLVSSGGFSQFLGFIYIAVIIWLFFPLILSAHGIFVNKDKMTVSLMKSIHLTRMTLPATSLFIICAFFVMQGLDIIWGWPEEDSWLVLIGLMGHAFVSTSILAASFIYYKDADLWAQRFLRQVLLQQNT